MLRITGTILMTLAGMAQGQAVGTKTTVEHRFTSAAAPFTVVVPEQWSTEVEADTSEVSFQRGTVVVRVSADKIAPDGPVEFFLQVSEMELKKACPTAVEVEHGAQKVAGTDGKYFVMRCQGPPGAPTDVRSAAAYINGRLYAFSTTVLTKYVEAAKPVFDEMLASFQVVPDRSLETPAQKKARYAAADAAFDKGHAEVKKLCASGKVTAAECTAKVEYLNAEHEAGTKGSDKDSGTVITF